MSCLSCCEVVVVVVGLNAFGLVYLESGAGALASCMALGLRSLLRSDSSLCILFGRLRYYAVFYDLCDVYIEVA
jgi:hypothetical protein